MGRNRIVMAFDEPLSDLEFQLTNKNGYINYAYEYRLFLVVITV